MKRIVLLLALAAAVVAACRYLRGSGYVDGHDPRLHEETELPITVSTTPKTAR